MNYLVSGTHSFSFEIKRHVTSLNLKTLSFSFISKLLIKDLDFRLNSNRTDQQNKDEIPKSINRPDFSCAWEMVQYWNKVLKQKSCISLHLQKLGCIHRMTIYIGNDLLLRNSFSTLDIKYLYLHTNTSRNIWDVNIQQNFLQDIISLPESNTRS